eukprot:m.86445 g.86445  ORF g.86445 m.86445 type:complete len:449 (+) comp8432_c0_seq5:154-1500(+)
MPQSGKWRECVCVRACNADGTVSASSYRGCFGIGEKLHCEGKAVGVGEPAENVADVLAVLALKALVQDNSHFAEEPVPNLNAEESLEALAANQKEVGVLGNGRRAARAPVAQKVVDGRWRLSRLSLSCCWRWCCRSAFCENAVASALLRPARGPRRFLEVELGNVLCHGLDVRALDHLLKVLVCRDLLCHCTELGVVFTLVSRIGLNGAGEYCLELIHMQLAIGCEHLWGLASSGHWTVFVHKSNTRPLPKARVASSGDESAPQHQRGDAPHGQLGWRSRCRRACLCRCVHDPRGEAQGAARSHRQLHGGPPPGRQRRQPPPAPCPSNTTSKTEPVHCCTAPAVDDLVAGPEHSHLDTSGREDPGHFRDPPSDRQQRLSQRGRYYGRLSVSASDSDCGVHHQAHKAAAPPHGLGRVSPPVVCVDHSALCGHLHAAAPSRHAVVARHHQ